MIPVLAALAAILILTGLLLGLSGLRRRPAQASPVRTTLVPSVLRKLMAPGRFTPRTKLLLAGGALAGVVVGVTTGWVVAVIVLPAAAAGIPALLLTSEAGATIARLEAMQEWTRSLAGVLTVGAGLEQALISTLHSTPEAIRPEITTLVARIRARWSTRATLRAFADDLDDATGDLIVYNLLLAARDRGAGLTSVLEGLADTVTRDVRIRRAIEADRAKPRATARWITLIGLAAMMVMVLFRQSYIASYRSGVGQLTLLLLLGAYAACLLWLRSAARGTKMPRFLGDHLRGQAGPA